MVLEPISKLLQEHGDGCQFHKTQEVGGVVLPTDQHRGRPDRHSHDVHENADHDGVATRHAQRGRHGRTWLASGMASRCTAGTAMYDAAPQSTTKSA
jgi:hypothetical protein